MGRIRIESDTFRRAALVCLAAFAINAAIHTGAEKNVFTLHVGDILLYMVAGAFGPLGACLAILFGSIPYGLLVESSSYVLKSSALLLVVGYAARQFPKAPPFIVVIVAWMVAVGPTLHTVSAEAPNVAWSEEARVFSCVTDTLLALIAGCLLLNQTAWCALTKKPRRTLPSELLIHIMPLCTVLTFLVAVATLTRIGVITSATLVPSNVSAIIGLFAMTVLIPAALSLRVADLAHRYSVSEDTAFRINSNAPFTHDGEDHWRRQLSTKTKWEPSVVDRDPRGLPADWYPKATILFDHLGTIIEYDGAVGHFGSVLASGILLKNAAMPDPLRKAISFMIEQLSERERQIQEIIVPAENGLPLRAVEIRVTRTGENRAWIELADISHRRILETRMVSAQRVDALGSLVVGLTRTFTDALTAIMGRAGEAKLTTDATKIQEAIRDIERHAKDAGILTQQLLDFADQYSPSIAKIDLAKLVKDQLPLLKSFEGHSCSISSSVPEDPLYVEADSILIVQALTNLIANSQESFNPNGGSISLSLDKEEIEADGPLMHPEARPGTYARLRVRDTGSGMNTEVLSRAFDPLFTTKSEGGKAGLGLSTVLSIVRAHNGFLTAESKAEKGTIVSLYLPLTQPSSDEGSSESPEYSNIIPELGDAPKGRNQNVLVVQERDELRDVLTSMLNTLGYRATACRSADEAVNFAQSNDVQLLVVDEVVGHHSCSELISQLRSVRSEMQALFLTPSAKRNDGNNRTVLRKPFNLNELGTAVHQAIEKGT